MNFLKSILLSPLIKMYRRRSSPNTYTVYGEPISFFEIYNSIKTSNREICGFITKYGKRIKVNEGPQIIFDEYGTRLNRGMCPNPILPVLWHTHPKISKYYPSIEDLLSIIESDIIEKSYIYTIYGYWTIKYLHFLDDYTYRKPIIDLITDASNKFYWRTGRGREYNLREINQFIQKINQLKDIIGNTFSIEWHRYS